MVNAPAILKALKKEYPLSAIALKFSNPLEILVATVLSAQCTDKMVNKVTKKLFKKYRTVRDYATADIRELEKDIHSTGFYRNKARNIQNACRIILEKHKGKVPDIMEELVKLPGVARKTANIVLSNAFGKVEGIPVDTHVKRFSVRTGLSRHNNPDKIEKDLMKTLPKKEWFGFSYHVIEHGRQCKYKKPGCSICKFARYKTRK